MDPKKELEELTAIVTKEGGSDLHVSTGRYPTVRVAGELIPLVKRPVLSKEDVSGLLSLLLNEEKKKIFLERRQVDFSYTTPGGTRFRGNAFFQQETVSIALRLIPAEIKTLSELNLPSVLESFTRRKQGFFLVVGPTGHGKSTTLASLIDLINKERAEHIITVEDPIEFIFKQERSIIDQREVGVDIPDFHVALQSMFRQDVDVLMIGEMRDPETISVAVTAAETGHLVFSTLHTNNASQTIDRIIDSFPSEQQGQIRAQLAQSLAGILSQRLIPRISGGLIPSYELLINNSAVANLIRERRVHEINVVIETGMDAGMIDMNRTLTDLVRRGEISIDSARSRSMDVKGLEKMI